MRDQSNTPVTPSIAEGVVMVMQDMLARRAQVEAALAHTTGTHTFDDIVGMVLAGVVRFWALPNSTFMVTEVIHYPQQRHFHVFLAGGNLDEIYSAHDGLIEAAKLAGCSAITLGGRRGWVKALQHLGWKEYSTTAVLSLSAEPNDEESERKSDDLSG